MRRLLLIPVLFAAALALPLVVAPTRVNAATECWCQSSDDSSCNHFTTAQVSPGSTAFDCTECTTYCRARGAGWDSMNCDDHYIDRCTSAGTFVTSCTARAGTSCSAGAPPAPDSGLREDCRVSCTASTCDPVNLRSLCTSVGGGGIYSDADRTCTARLYADECTSLSTLYNLPPPDPADAARAARCTAAGSTAATAFIACVDARTRANGFAEECAGAIPGGCDRAADATAAADAACARSSAAFAAIGTTCTGGAAAPTGPTVGPGGSRGAPAPTLPNPLGGTTDVRTIIARIIQAALGISGSLALLMFIWGGMLWLTSGGSPERIQKGKNTIVWAVLGLVLIFGSYAILNFVLGTILGTA